MRSIIFLLSVIFLFQSQAQSDYLVKSSGDTLYGKITFRIPETYKEVVSIKTNDGIQTVNSNRIIVCVADSKSYRSILYKDKFRIMEEVIPGYLTLYNFRIEDSHEFSTRFLNKESQEGIELSSIGFRTRLIKFFEDCPELASAIENKTFRYKDLEEIVKYYNENCLREIGQSQNLQNPDEFQDLAELQSLLKDILDKKESGEDIPGYLVEALQKFTENDVNARLQKLLEDLKDN